MLSQTFSLHIGGVLKVPTVDKRKTHVAEVQPKLSATERAAASDPFAGLPLRAWADKLGERVAPAFQAIQEEQRKANLAAAKLKRLDQPLSVSNVPHVFPITRWCDSALYMQDDVLDVIGPVLQIARMLSLTSKCYAGLPRTRLCRRL